MGKNLFALPFVYDEFKSYYSNRIMDLRVQFGLHCWFCGDNCEPTIENGEFQFAHRHGFLTDVDGTGRGQSRRVHDISNHPISYLLLCDKCHKKYDGRTGKKPTMEVEIVEEPPEIVEVPYVYGEKH